MSNTALHLREMVDEYAELTRQQTAIKDCLEALKARFEKHWDRNVRQRNGCL